MSKKLQRFLTIILPSLIFLVLARTSHHLLLGQLSSSNAGAILAKECEPNDDRKEYVGIETIDQTLCILTTFFHAAFDPDLSPLLIEFGVSLSVLVALPFLEMSRVGHAWTFTWPIPVVFLLFGQLYGVGACFPIFWLAMIVSGHATTKHTPRMVVDQAHAEAVFFALCAGYLIPSALMIVLQDPAVTAMWQAFPIWMTVAWGTHIFLRPSPSPIDSGRRMVYSTYLFTFAISAAAHTYTVWPLMSNGFADVADNFFPQLSTLSVNEPNLTTAVKFFLQWDLCLSFGTTFIGTLWFSDSLLSFAALLLWYITAIAVVGPGAAVSGALCWREWKLNGGEW